MVLRITDVSADAILLAGGARAILLQLANPGVGHGVAEHSDFVDRPLDRLHGTLTYLYVTVYGSPDEARSVARAVGQAHRPVTGASDPELQLWVAATLYDTAMQVRELVYGPLSAEDGQSLLSDYAMVGTALGVPRSSWPVDRAAFAAYWSSEALAVDDIARGMASALLHPTNVPWWMRVLMPTVRVITAGLLPPELRAAYGLEFNERRFQRLVRTARIVYPRLPRLIRHAPMRRYLRAFRARELP
ncbi:MAG: DUF2236 domain-containing protein [Salinibacterium sp.]|nr:DUF2236 domain-containing protein [Salinibacterium sp.]